MERKPVLMTVIAVLLMSMLCVTVRVEKVQADEIIGDEAFKALTTLPSNMPVVFVDPRNKTAGLGDTITISIKIFNLTNTVYLGGISPPSPDTWAWGEPLPPPGSPYNYSLGNLYAFEIQFSWNALILDYVNHTVKVPVDTYPDGVLWDPAFLAYESLDVDTGAFTTAYSSLGGPYGAPVFNCPDDNATVFEMTFNVIRIGKSHLNITWSDLAVSLQPGYDDFYPVIPHCVVNGQFQTEVLATRIKSLDVKPFDNETFFTLPVISGESAFISASTINDGSITDTYNLTLLWGLTLLDSWLSETLEPGEQKNYNYTIDEAELSIGNHTITAMISVLHNSSLLVDETINQLRVIGTPILTILGPFTAELGGTIYYTTNSTHSDPEGVILNYTWALWAPGDTLPIITKTGEDATFKIHPLWTSGSWFVTLDIRDNYGIEYQESRPASRAWHSEESVQIIPEFPSLIILPLFMIVTLAAIIYGKKKSNAHQPS